MPLDYHRPLVLEKRVSYQTKQFYQSDLIQLRMFHLLCSPSVSLAPVQYQLFLGLIYHY